MASESPAKGGASPARGDGADAAPHATLAIVADRYEDGWRATVHHDGGQLDRSAPTLVEVLALIAVRFDYVDRTIE